MVKDSMGEMEVPHDALYGASTMRAVQNFPISGTRFPRRFIGALGLIKKAAAEVNGELELIPKEMVAAIAQAAGEVAEGRWDAEFPIDIYQTGSGTSTNTNANEVIANRANQVLGAKSGLKVHPNDHVNRCQSSNDVIPTAIHLSSAMAAQEDLLPALEKLRGSLAKKAKQFMPIIKTGRTHIQDATPVRLGQEFLGYAGQVEEGIKRTGQALEDLREVALGGTAVGTGINAHPKFAAMVCKRLQAATGVKVRETSNHFHAQATLDAVVSAHGRFKTIAVSLWKIGGDIRLMGSGPRAGIGELLLPEVQPGSSIMPGKVNPVIIESLTMACARVIGNDASVTLCGPSGSFFELNVMMPLAGVASLESISLLARPAANSAPRRLDGIEATQRAPERGPQGPTPAPAPARRTGSSGSFNRAGAKASTSTTKASRRRCTRSAASAASAIIAKPAMAASCWR